MEPGAEEALGELAEDEALGELERKEVVVGAANAVLEVAADVVDLVVAAVADVVESIVGVAVGEWESHSPLWDRMRAFVDDEPAFDPG